MTGLLKIENRPLNEDFQLTLERQFELRDQKISDSNQPNSLLLVEHSPVYTSGRGSSFAAPISKPYSEIPHFEISRGGQTTFHGPGQLVAYPIFDLNQLGKDVHVFLRKLEGVIILFLKRYKVNAVRRKELTGVWVERGDGEYKKIASIGVGVKRWVSYHGISINLDCDLRYFKAISPCGQNGQVMTSLAEEIGELPSREELHSTLITCFLKVFKLELEDKSIETDKQFRPDWIKAAPQMPGEFSKTRELIDNLSLVTVCEEARCPNIGECWSHRTATFMIMGENCTRRCGFCSVKDGMKGDNLEPLDIFEPHKVAVAVQKLGLRHVVITSVNRDDLEDMGASHFDKVVRQIKSKSPECRIELLIPDMRGDKKLLEDILASGEISVLNHNVETVPRLYKTVRPGSKFERSLDVLRWASEVQSSVKTKSGFMVGLGESEAEVIELLKFLREAGVDIVTIGQYLRPTEKQLPIAAYITPEQFEFYRQVGMEMGFPFVESGPLVRSSYHAWKHADGALDYGEALESPLLS